MENFNGLVRQYFPKGADFGGITGEMLRKVEDELNDRPRSVLDYAASADLVDQLTVS